MAVHVALFIVVAGRDRLLPDLHAFYRSLGERHAGGRPLNNLVCITGCSRTADIEKLLAIPALGPRQVCVILCDEAVSWSSYRQCVTALRRQ